jgi:predicted nucleic acid-binding protein
MIQGADTTFLVVLEIREAAGRLRAQEFLSRRIVEAGEPLALAPRILAEFVHIVTDPCSFQRHLAMEEELRKADLWWNAEEVRQVSPGTGAVALFNHWMFRYRLGRKRMLDTLLAATYADAGVRRIISTNVRDYQTFEELEVIDPTGAA